MDYIIRRSKMNEEAISINDVVEHDDGSSTDKVRVVDDNEFSKETKTHELSDDEANALFHFGFLYAIKAGMEGLNND